MLSSLQKVTKFKENLYEMYAAVCHQIPDSLKVCNWSHQIPGILIATLAAFAQP
jgi:hypothetical protein